jgi:uncharacterized membrane protein
VPKKDAEKDNQSMQESRDEKALFIIAYLLEIFTGIIILLMKGEEDQRLKFHCMQAILFGILSIAIAIIFGLLSISFVATALNLLIWLFGMYVGLEAYNGRNVRVPVISDYAQRYSGYDAWKKSK